MPEIEVSRSKAVCFPARLFGKNANKKGPKGPFLLAQIV
jgi:hypothetical protein